MLVALDTGLQISELRGRTRQNVDLDNLVLCVQGKGNKQRLVPISIELRKVLYRYMANHQRALAFATETGTRVSVRNAKRDFKVMCGKLGITGVRALWHTLRHTFAVNYLRAGGNLYYLQRILGHSSITTTERYLRSLGIEKELDILYKSGENVRIPLPFEFQYYTKKLKGTMTKQQLEEELIQLRSLMASLFN